MKGRRPKPTKTKKLSGTLRPSRVNENEPVPSDERPLAPHWLSPTEIEHFYRLVGILEVLGRDTKSVTGPPSCWKAGRWKTSASFQEYGSGFAGRDHPRSKHRGCSGWRGGFQEMVPLEYGTKRTTEQCTEESRNPIKDLRRLFHPTKRTGR